MTSTIEIEQTLNITANHPFPHIKLNFEGYRMSVDFKYRSTLTVIQVVHCTRNSDAFISLFSVLTIITVSWQMAIEFLKERMTPPPSIHLYSPFTGARQISPLTSKPCSSLAQEDILQSKTWFF